MARVIIIKPSCLNQVGRVRAAENLEWMGEWAFVGKVIPYVRRDCVEGRRDKAY